MALLGDDGRGYELARKLETVGVWRTWLGESNYTIFLRFLDSPSTWEAFMRVEDSKSRAQIHLQLRVRALLFDKASVSLFLRSNPSSSSSLASSSLAVSKLNSTCEFLFFLFIFFFWWNFWLGIDAIVFADLQLHGDDVYFTLENSAQDVVQPREGGVSSNTASSKVRSLIWFYSAIVTLLKCNVYLYFIANFQLRLKWIMGWKVEWNFDSSVMLS